MVDRLGNPLAFILIGGQVHDSIPAIELLQDFDITESNILSDKTYEAKEICE
ncbi:hypothetical protein [Melissococcus plutonius]|uniref:hypothetical protein n=1 Tax=Melissococcus plutonius TaxID=33970 RepID=UPI0012D776AB|nr:hypothetical protein [Melissococcus plutonius]MCV2507257.1 hypothetical protein [Melissococcus plutonius]MCV2519241.1 hypothetical protein [Melissococcus plutonius]